MGAITGFLANYGTNVRVALIIWPFISIMLTLPILAYLYHRDGRLRFSAIVATYLSVLYLLGLACFTMWPLPEGASGPGITYGIEPNFIPFAFIADIQKDGLSALFGLLANVIFFMPLGFIAGRFLHMRIVPAVVLSLGVSAMIELAQLTGLFGFYDYSYRCCDVDDLMSNTLGGLLGWLLAALYSKLVPQKTESAETTSHPGFIRRCVALWLDLSIIGIASGMIWMIANVAYQLITGHPMEFLGLTSAQTGQLCCEILYGILFLIDEVVVPWCNEGKTLGGAFVRMTCEGHDRTMRCRIAFYALRTLVLVLLLAMPLLMVPVLMIFYAVKRCMPYDLIP